MVRGEQIVALILGDVGEIRLPGIGIEHRRATLVEPVEFLLPEEEDAAQDDFGHAVGMSLRISEG